jgi:hypothetical protein
MIEQRDIVVWGASALLAFGIFSSRWAKAKSRNNLIRSLLAMAPEQRQKKLDRMNPQMAMELRQALLERYGIMS